MNLLIAIVALLSLPAVAMAGDQPPSLHGKWQFYKKIYQDKEMPEPPSATLRMFFQFSPDGESKLWWWHEGESDHCQRKGKFSEEGNLLVDEVTWVDPENTPLCAQDTDMQLGKVSRTPYKFRGPDLSLELHIGDEPLEMIWKSIPLP